ncbi:MAG: hypothetical protein P9X24_05835 [Candidatus Hatepunaea meridiana]|nr:hypothetical protein [Candidatus Hatepunaea meridiana]
MLPTTIDEAPIGYGELLEDLKTRIRASQIKATLAASRELINFYRHIGRAYSEIEFTVDLTD